MNRREILKSSALLMGYSLSSNVFSGLLSGCQVSTSPDWTPAFFTSDELRVVQHLMEQILPRTDTPGAKDVFVDRFLDKLVKETFPPEQQQQFREGLSSLISTSREEYGDPFDKLNAADQDAIVTGLDASINTSTPNFYAQFKGLCLTGYFTSEEIGKNHLSYDPIPGRFEGCIPLEEVDKVWAL